MRLVADQGCPFAQRVLALALHVGLELDRVEAPIGHTHPVALAHSPTGRVPLLLHEGLVIGESVVIGDYVSELSGWLGFPDQPRGRARHREAMALFDAYVVPGVFRSTPVDARTKETLHILAALVADLPAEPSRLAFHLAPFHHRLVHWYPKGALGDALRRHPVLDVWLDAVCALGPVAATSPSAAQAAEHIQAAAPLLASH